MAETLRTIERQPEAWPGTQSAAVWQRIESYCAHRWTPREVIWLVQGDGEWMPPLTPAAITKVESWEGEWREMTPDASPFGGIILRGDNNRVTATVGANNPAPPAVMEAAWRLARYVAENEVEGGFFDMPRSATSFDANLDGLSKSFERPVGWLARAMQNSGAADLLRPYRRAW